MADQSIIQKNLLEELGLSGLPKEKQDELLGKMTEVLLKRMFVETAEKLNENDQGEFAKMIEERNSPDKIEDFLKGNIKDYDQMLEKIVADFKDEMKKGIAG